jgi:hypothetical protein
MQRHALVRGHPLGKLLATLGAPTCVQHDLVALNVPGIVLRRERHLHWVWFNTCLPSCAAVSATSYKLHLTLLAGLGPACVAGLQLHLYTWTW